MGLRLGVNSDLVIQVDGALPHDELDHEVAALQGEIVVVCHGNDHLTKHTANLQT